MANIRTIVDLIPDKDVVFGQDYYPTIGYIGNYKFKKFIYDEIYISLLEADENDDGDNDNWTDGFDVAIQRYKNEINNNNVRFFLAVSPTEFLLLEENGDNLKSLLRQLYNDCYIEMNQLDDPYDEYVLNYEEVRLKWFHNFAPNTHEHMFLRLFDEVPIREEILYLYVIPNALTEHEQEVITVGRMNTYCMTNNTVTLRQYKSFQAYGQKDYILSENLGLFLNTFLVNKGIHTNAYPDVVDGWKILFPLHVTENTIINWFEVANLRDHSPFKDVGEIEGSLSMISALRKVFTSICYRPGRIIAPHVLYVDGNTDYPNWNTMVSLQLHTDNIAERHYLYNVQRILNSKIN